MPGFAIFFEAHLFGFAMRVEAQHRRGHAGANGQDIPDVESRNVSDEKIQCRWGHRRRGACRRCKWRAFRERSEAAFLHKASQLGALRLQFVCATSASLGISAKPGRLSIPEGDSLCESAAVGMTWANSGTAGVLFRFVELCSTGQPRAAVPTRKIRLSKSPEPRATPDQSRHLHRHRRRRRHSQ